MQPQAQERESTRSPVILSDDAKESLSARFEGSGEAKSVAPHSHALDGLSNWNSAQDQKWTPLIG